MAQRLINGAIDMHLKLYTIQEDGQDARREIYDSLPLARMAIQALTVGKAGNWSSKNLVWYNDDWSVTVSGTGDWYIHEHELHTTEKALRAAIVSEIE